MKNNHIHKLTKKIKVREMPKGGKKKHYTPVIILQGLQLEKYGFILNSCIDVTFSNGLITIKPVQP